MTGDDVIAWIDSLFPGARLTTFDGLAVANSSLDGVPVAVTCGFSGVDSGLLLDDDPLTTVRCEIALRANADRMSMAMVLSKAVRELAALGVPAQPGVLLEGLQAGRVRHGWLREPELFTRGTPLVREPGQLTLLLELVMLTDEEFAIASEQGTDVLTTRLRRRGVDPADWLRK